MTEPELLQFASEFMAECEVGDLVMLFGDLGAGKTTFVRGALASLGVTEGVRSPTFNLIQTFATHPPVLHADLYRLKDSRGLGLEDDLDRYVSFIEWPDRLVDEHLEGRRVWRIHIDFEGEGRRITVTPPNTAQ